MENLKKYRGIYQSETHLTPELTLCYMKLCAFLEASDFFRCYISINFALMISTKAKEPLEKTVKGEELSGSHPNFNSLLIFLKLKFFYYFRSLIST